VVEQAGSYGQYELLRPFSHGQVTEVFLAREKGAAGPRGLLVVHRVLASLAQNSEFTNAFLNEAGVAGTLKHPNFVELYDLGELEGQVFVAQEYVPGGSLHELLDRRGGKVLPLGVALYVVGEVCAGLQFAHALAGPDGVPRNLVHGAVNPRHVLVSVDGVVKIADFGMRTAMAILGTPPQGDRRVTDAFLAPEQGQGLAVDRRVDIYACGALLYYLTTGELPLAEPGSALRRPREVRQDLPEEIESIIVKAMANAPRDRHPTCGALRRDVSKTVEALKLQGDLASLSALIRAEFPEVSVGGEPRAPGEGGEPATTAPASSAMPLKFPPPPGDMPSPTAAATDGREDAPFLDEGDLVDDATERYRGLSEDGAGQVLGAAAAAQGAWSAPIAPRPVMAQEPAPRRRSIWLWIALVLGGGTLLLLVAAAVVLAILWPRLTSEPSDLMVLLGLSRPSDGAFTPTQPLGPPPGSELKPAQPGASALPPLQPPPPLPPPLPLPPPDATKLQPGVPPGDVPGTSPPGDASPSKTDPVQEREREREEEREREREEERERERARAREGSDGGAEEPAKTESRPRGDGFVYVLTSPSSKVYMDSRLLGVTPIMKRAVAAGRHSLVLVSPGFSPKRFPINVTPGQTTQVRHLFTQGD
jgi:serine/threonine protein kinase